MGFPASVQVLFTAVEERSSAKKLEKGAMSPTAMVTPWTTDWKKHVINLLMNKESGGDRSTGLSLWGLARVAS